MKHNDGLVLLGGLSADTFMRRHWQKKPLLVRQAWPGVTPPLARSGLFDLAGQDDVESRLVQRDVQRDVPYKVSAASAWRVRQGPLPRRALPAVRTPGWTLLVQGLDLHVPAARRVLDAFDFVPAARLDDLMVSWASDGGGVGPHLDSYDVFLLQVQGQRRWRVGRTAKPVWQEGAALKLLANFEPQHEWLVQAGDMLYLPPGWGHDGVAEGGDCMTCSVGFRAPEQTALAAELLQRIAEAAQDAADVGPGDAGKAPRLYRDPQQPATAQPAAIPAALRAFAQQAVARLLAQPAELQRALGEVFTEPKPQVWFRAGPRRVDGQGLQLAPATRMLYDGLHVFINGESFRAGGRDATLLQRLADARQLPARDCARLSAPAAELVGQWLQHGWLLTLVDE